MKAKTDIKKLREIAEAMLRENNALESCLIFRRFNDSTRPETIIEILDRLNEAEAAIKGLEQYWFGSYRGGESARRYAQDWGL